MWVTIYILIKNILFVNFQIKYCVATEPNRIYLTESEPSSVRVRMRVRVRFGKNSNLIRFGSVATQIRNFHSSDYSWTAEHQFWLGSVLYWGRFEI